MSFFNSLAKVAANTIVVNSNSATPFLITLLRNALIAAAPAVGITSQDTAVQIASGVITAGGALYGAAKAYKSNQQKIVMATKLPDPVAVVK